MTENYLQDQNLETAKFVANLLGDKSFFEALEDGRTFTWAPVEDITPYELALCMNLIIVLSAGRVTTTQFKMFDALPLKAQRHFKVTVR